MMVSASAMGSQLTHVNLYCTSCLWVFTALTMFTAVVLGQQDSSATLINTECYNYEISFGVSHEFLTCCKKATSSPTESQCTQETLTVPNFQCKQPPNYKRSNVTQRFNCNGATGQKNAMKRCYTRWAWLEQDTDDPECWAWSQCFVEACKQEEDRSGLSISGDFCGDGRCDTSIEDSDSCPIDCCPQDNPDMCQVTNNTCPEACCGQPLCCIPETGSSSVDDIILWTVVGVVGFVVLLNIVCCCCCCCCAKRCCKKRKSEKKKKHDKNTVV